MKVIPRRDFSWRYDRMYSFKFGGVCDIPDGLYHQAKHMFDLVDEAEKPKAKKEKIKEVPDGEPTE